MDPANYSISNFTWVAVDTPNLFAINRTSGVIYNTAIVDTLALSKGTWSYSVSVCNPYICGVYPISIVVAQVCVCLWVCVSVGVLRPPMSFLFICPFHRSLALQLSVLRTAPSLKQLPLAR